MPTIFQTKDRNGVPHRNWRFKYIDWLGNRKTATGLPTKEATKKLANKIQTEQDEIRVGLRPRPKESDLPRPFEIVAAEYLAWGQSQGGRGGRPWSETHLRMRGTHLNFWKQQLALEFLSDVQGSLAEVEFALRELQKSGRTGKTLQNYAEALAALCDWALVRGYLDVDPLKNLHKFDSTPKTIRRALTEDEVNRFLNVAPADRRILYEIALATGLRANELRCLRVRHIDRAAGGLALEAGWTKNRKSAIQPLHPVLITKLIEYSAQKDAQAPLLIVPHATAGLVYRDLAAANIPKVTPEGKVDFHALRVAYITMVYEAGASGKEAQTMSRHSTPALTEIRYARTRADRLNQLALAVGDRFVAPAKCPTGVQSEDGHGTVASQSTALESTYDDKTSSRYAGSIPADVANIVAANSGRLAHSPGLKLSEGGQDQEVGHSPMAESRTTPVTAADDFGQRRCPTDVQWLLASSGVFGFKTTPIPILPSFSGRVA